MCVCVCWFGRVHFSETRLGSTVVLQVVEDLVRNDTFEFFYRPLSNIMSILGHTKATLHVLKLDIEGGEWDVFSKSIFKVGHNLFCDKLCGYGY